MDKKNNALANIDTANTTVKKAPYKIELCLNELLSRGCSGLVELEALQAYGETCLHSTISTLANSHQLTFKRVSHQHTGRHGSTVRFTRYILANEQQNERATALLQQYRVKRSLAAKAGT